MHNHADWKQTDIEIYRCIYMYSMRKNKCKVISFTVSQLLYANCYYLCVFLLVLKCIILTFSPFHCSVPVQVVVMCATNYLIIEHHLVLCWVSPCCRPHHLMSATIIYYFDDHTKLNNIFFNTFKSLLFLLQKCFDFWKLCKLF